MSIVRWLSCHHHLSGTPFPRSASDWLPDEELDLDRWASRERSVLRKDWLEFLGTPESVWPGRSILLDESEHPYCRIRTYSQETGPAWWQKVAILSPPPGPTLGPLPCAVVPFYQCGVPAGSADGEPDEALAFGLHLVRQGFVVACVEAFPYNLLPDGEYERPFGRWQRAADILKHHHPRWTGAGKLASDTSLAVDLLLQEPNIDPERLLIMGHSLGGKMALLTALYDERISSVIASDFGLAPGSTNWGASWYFGTKITSQPQRTLDQVLSILAPRPFLLIAGEFDGVHSWPYLESARRIYGLYERAHCLGCIDHRSGHRPSLCSLDMAYAWLGEIFGLEPNLQWRS